MWDESPDLNPIHACVAQTPETSEFTAAFERIAARREASPVVADSALVEENVVAAQPQPAPARDAWLSLWPKMDGCLLLLSRPRLSARFPATAS